MFRIICIYVNDNHCHKHNHKFVIHKELVPTSSYNILFQLYNPIQQIITLIWVRVDQVCYYSNKKVFSFLRCTFHLNVKSSDMYFFTWLDFIQSHHKRSSLFHFSHPELTLALRVLHKHLKRKETTRLFCCQSVINTFEYTFMTIARENAWSGWIIAQSVLEFKRINC